MNYSIRQRIIRNGRQDFLRPERKQIRFPHFAGFAENLDMRSMEMDLICAGENFYASMRRSTNGGGENSPKLLGEDDFYELFFAGLENDK